MTVLWLALLPLVSPAAPLTFGDGPRMNQIQVIGTHNSYHKRPKSLSTAVKVNQEAKAWDYEHLPLDIQLDNRVRSLELDLHNTPEGWQVFHVPMFDQETSCREFTGCLNLVKAWSGAHPRHVPISFLMEHKDEGPRLTPRITMPNAADLDRLDADIRSVFPREQIITPDDVRGDFATLEEAVLKRGWPSLESARGKVFFIFHEIEELRDLYTRDRPSLQGRMMFVRSRPGRPDAAAMVCDNPYDPDIPDLVRRGYWIRTTAGGPGRRGLEAANQRRDRALECGAQIVSSDYPPGEPHAETGYVVALPGGVPVRWNPVCPPPDISFYPEASP